ncbi:hypothetical protein [Halomonas sp. C22]|uniref:hypothetical protein n=1 Tax=Halomonas sp. C22 TaxID=2580567 RepID=UPI0011A2852E|nr:hypothetical protein [Halomonas sp. C22]
MEREQRAKEAPAKGGASRPDKAIITHHATATPVPPPAALSALLRGCASLTPRYGYPGPPNSGNIP